MIMEELGVIYKIVSPTGRIYIGKTRHLAKRIKQHRRNCHSHILAASIKKYGFESHIISVIEEVSITSLNEREKYWISELQTNVNIYPNGNGMNLTNGGDGVVGRKFTENEKLNMSKRVSGIGNPMYGKNHTFAAREKISVANSGKTMSPAHRKIMSEYNKTRILQIDRLTYKIIAEYDSIGTAIKVLNLPTDATSHISKACSGKRQVAYGSYWRYANNNTDRIFGTHMMFDLYGVPQDIAENYNIVFNFLNKMPGFIDMTIVIPPYVIPYSGKIPNDRGLTGMTVLAESHISVHTFSLHGTCYIDVFSCKPYDIGKTTRAIKETFKPKNMAILIQDRGFGFKHTGKDKLGLKNKLFQ